MQIKTKAIVLSAVKYQDKGLIVKCFTLSDGMKSYFVRDAFSNKKTSQKIIYFQPLTILKIEATHKNKGSLAYFKEISVETPFHGIHCNVFKSSIVLFVAEILQHAIKEEERNENLFTFLETALNWLESHNMTANFHLIMLLETSKYLGFYPDFSRTDLLFFEMIEGCFSNSQAISCLNAADTELIKKLFPLKFEDTQAVFNVKQRQALLKILIDYYSIHLDGFRKPKSLEVLQEIFV